MDLVEIVPSARQMVSAVYEAVDSMDEGRFVECLTETCTFVYGNGAPVTGRQDVAMYVKQFMTMIARIKHELVDAWTIDDMVFAQTNVTYTRQDNSVLTVPAATIWRMSESKIQDYRIYVDISQLFVH
jgi:hypothetical protein